MSKFKNRYIILLAGRTVRLCNFETVPFSFFLFTFFFFSLFALSSSWETVTMQGGRIWATERKTRDVGVWLENLAKPPPWYSDSRCPPPWEGEVYSHPEPSCFRVLMVRAETFYFYSVLVSVLIGVTLVKRDIFWWSQPGAWVLPAYREWRPGVSLSTLQHTRHSSSPFQRCTWLSTHGIKKPRFK